MTSVSAATPNALYMAANLYIARAVVEDDAMPLTTHRYPMPRIAEGRVRFGAALALLDMLGVCHMQPQADLKHRLDLC